MELIIINKFSDFLALKDEWQELQAKCRSESIFMSHAWLTTWWSCLDRESELLLITIRDNGELIAVAPFKLSSDTMRSLPVRLISFLGASYWTTADLLISRSRREAVDSIAGFLLDMDWDLIDLQNVPAGSENIKMLNESLSAKGVPSTAMKAASFPFIAPDTSWEEFYQSRSTRFKKSTRNKLNKIQKAGEVIIERHTTPEEVTSVLSVIFNIALKGWKHRIGCSISSTLENRIFYTELSRIMAERGCIDIWTLSIDGVPVAFEYHLRSNGYVKALVADFDQGYKALSPGSVLDFHIIKTMFEERVRIYNMGSGNSFYKSNWTDRSFEFERFYLYRKSAYGKLLRLTENRLVPYAKLIRDKLTNGGGGKNTA